jgi:hypothetical protein
MHDASPGCSTGCERPGVRISALYAADRLPDAAGVHHNPDNRKEIKS